MQRVLAVSVLAALVAVLSLGFLAGCGGGSTSSTNTVTQIILSPTTISLNEGAVVTLSAIAENAAGGTVAADIAFTSSNTSIATVSSGGLVCGGVWDANIINCNFTNGTGGVGQAVITATSGSVTATASVFVHERVDQVTTLLGSNCTSSGQAVGISGHAFSTSAPGCSTASPCDITSTVGPFAFGSNDTSIVDLNSSSVLTAAAPGATSVFSSVSGVNSVGVPYLTCPVATILVHSSVSSSTAFTVGVGGTETLTADVYDINGQYVKPTLNWGSSSTATATVAATGTVNNPGTATAVAGGTAYITASCSYPNCNKFVAAQYSQNVVTLTVTGSTSTTVYAASSNSKSLVPISTSANTAGTAITLPNYPNSIIGDPAGKSVYLGSSTGLMAVAAGGTTVTTFPVNGTIVAISPDGQYMLLSDSVAGSLNYFSITNGAISSSLAGVITTSDAYTPDSLYNEWLSGTTLGVGLPTGLSGQFTAPNAVIGVDFDAQGALNYVTSAVAQQIYVYSTCNTTLQQTLTANAPTLIKGMPNGTGAVAIDSPAIDVITTPSTVNAGCPTTTQSTINSYDLGAGPFTAQQVFINSDNSRVWIATNLPDMLVFYLPALTPTAIPLTGGATPFNGGITQDGSSVYVGTSDGTVHLISVSTLTDSKQIAVGLTDSNGNATPPNLVTVLP
jgi:hypothetical protein